MKASRRAALTLAILACSSFSFAAPAKSLCDDPGKTHTLEASTSGEIIEGPACVQVTFNALRYSAQLVKTITFTAGPNLTSVLPQAGTPTGAETGKPPVVKAVGPTLEQAFKEIYDRVNAKPTGLAAQFYTVRQAQNRRVSATVDNDLIELKNTIIQSDEMLNAGQAPAVLKVVKSPDFQSGLQNSVINARAWKTTDDMLPAIHTVQQDLAALPQLFARPVSGVTTGADSCDTAAWQQWFTQCGGESRYKILQDQLAKLEKDASDMASGSDEAQKIARKTTLLVYWQNLTAGLDEKAFQVKAEAGCGVLFNTSKQTAIKLVLTDRLVTFDGQTPQQQVKDPLVTVQCGSPFSISAGVGFSTIEDRAFALVKSAPSTGTNSVLRFGESSRSQVHPMPLAMAHGRVCDWDNNRYALHVSFGVAAAIKGQESGGSNAEYLTGLSVSLFRTIYLTGGLHIGQQAKLAGGFNVGDIVPPDITEPPVQKGYKAGFGFAITFTKP